LNVLRNFIRGLIKSFNGKDYLRKINSCDTCGKPSFMYRCLKCEMDEAYRGYGKE
jgi:hypothetical protein